MDIPQDVQQVIRTIESAGYTAWLWAAVSGTACLTKSRKTTTSHLPASPEYVCRLFKKCAKTGIVRHSNGNYRYRSG